MNRAWKKTNTQNNACTCEQHVTKKNNYNHMKHLLTTLLMVLLLGTTAFAQDNYHESMIEGSDYHSYSISPDGNWAAQGDKDNDNNGFSSNGAVKIYKRSADTWNLFQTIISPNPIDYGLFGRNVTLSNQMLIITEITDQDNYIGNVYTYKFNDQNDDTWSLVNTRESFLCSSLDLYEGETGIILAMGSGDYLGNPSSKVKVFHFSNDQWVEEASLSYYYSRGSFGVSVAVTPEYLIVGVPLGWGVGGWTGVAFLYRFEGNNTWAIQDTLQAPEPYDGQRFGHSVDINDDYIAVGTNKVNVADSINYAFLYDFNDGEAVFKEALYSSDNPATSSFGYSVSLNGSMLLVGAPTENHDDEGYDTGSAFLYKFGAYGTNLIKEFYMPVDYGNYYFGNNVILNDDYLAITEISARNNMYIYSGHGENILLSMGSMDVVPELADTVLVDIFIHLPEGEEINSAELPIRGNVAPANAEIIGFETEGTLVGENNWIAEFDRVDISNYNTAFAGAQSISGYGKFITLKIAILNPNIFNNTYEWYIDNNWEDTNPILFDDGLGYTVETLGGYMKVQHALVGDVDLNGTVQALDASYTLQYLASQRDLDQLQMFNADASANDTVSAFDASLILMYRVGSIDELPYTEPVPAAGEIIMLNNEIVANQIMTLPIDITNGNDIYSFESTVSFDEEVLAYEGFEASEDLDNYMIEIKEGVGYVKVIAASTTPTITEGSFFNLKFSLIEELTDGATTVEMTQLRLNENYIVENAGSSILSIVTSIDDEISNLPKEFALNQNYPNPFNPTTAITYALPETSNVTVAVFNTLGQMVETLVSGSQSAGTYKYNWNAANMSSGIYFVKIVAQGNATNKNFVDVKKMMLLK